jgi:PKD repeat protein
MKTLHRNILKTLLFITLVAAALQSSAATLRFVVVVYDAVTFNPIPGKQVTLEIQPLNSPGAIFSQSFTSSSNGEVISPAISLADSTWFRYTFSMSDCNAATIYFTDSLLMIQNDTLFLYYGVCHAVLPSSCQANFTHQVDPINPFLVSFTNTSSGNPSSWFWSFGDGTSSNIPNPVKQYNSPGAYLVCLTIADSSSNCQNTWCNVVSMNQGIVLQAAYAHQLDSFAQNPRLVHFTNQSQSNIPLNHFVWSFGDGTGALIQNPVHQYQHSGSFLVCLSAGIVGALHDSVCQTITIPQYFNLWGQAISNAGALTSGTAQLFNPLFSPTGYPAIAQMHIDTLGLFYFAQRISHPYLLRIVPAQNDPSQHDLLPTYPGNTLFWQNADQINLSGDIGNLNVTMMKKKNSGTGTCTVDGVVQFNAGAVAPNTLVLLTDAADQQPVASAWTDSAGLFSWNQLPFGSYLLQAEVPGLVSSVISFELSPQNTGMSGQDLFLSAISNTQNVRMEPVPDVYPNPAITHLTVKVPAPLRISRIIISSIEGKNIRSIPMNPSGDQQSILNVEDLPAGIYTLRVMTDQGSLYRKFIKQ